MFTIDFLKNNPDIILAALNVLDSFFKKRLHNDPNKDKYKIRSTVTKEIGHHVFKKYTYEGPQKSFKDFINMVKDDKND